MGMPVPAYGSASCKTKANAYNTLHSHLLDAEGLVKIGMLQYHLRVDIKIANGKHCKQRALLPNQYRAHTLVHSKIQNEIGAKGERERKREGDRKRGEWDRERRGQGERRVCAHLCER